MKVRENGRNKETKFKKGKKVRGKQKRRTKKKKTFLRMKKRNK